MAIHRSTSSRSSMLAHCLLLFLLATTTSRIVLAENEEDAPEEVAPVTDEQLMREEHWAMDGCIAATAKGTKYEHMREACRTCVLDSVDIRGDPTRCHACLKPHKKGHLPTELLETCLECVPAAEKKRLGWACTQYCAHHTWEGKFMNELEANQCLDCLYAEHPQDKWGCHVCMEQNAGQDIQREACYECIKKENQNPYQCAYCSRVPDAKNREACFTCMYAGLTGKECAAKYGVGDFVKPGDNGAVKKQMEEILAKIRKEGLAKAAAERG